MAVLSLDQFGKNAVNSGIFTAEELKALWAALPVDERPKSGDEFAATLVAAGKLNSFQADELLSNRRLPLVLGDYLLVAQIGAGGMGQVFKAQHRRLKRFAAVKLLPADAVKDAGAVRRFQREVEAVGRLSHPNIVQAHDAGEVRGRHFLAMEFVEGSDLASLVRKQGPIGVERAVDYIVQAARGLAYAHGHGVVHRDVKPANLLLDQAGVVKILDLGLARFEETSSSEGLTGTEQVMGTVDYMSPEQAADTKHADARTDVYALGCTLWYLLTGKRLYDGDTTISRVMKHRDAPLPSLVKARDDATWPLEQVFHKLIAKGAADRYQTMDDVIAALTPHLRPADDESVLSGGAAATDPNLATFLSGIGSTIGRGKNAPAATTIASTTSPPVPAPVEATASFAAADAESMVQNKIAKPAFRAPAPRSETLVRPPSGSFFATRAKLLAGAGAVLAVLIGVAVWRFNSDEPQASVQTGAAAAVVPVPRGTFASKPEPARAAAPFDAKQARALQAAWAEHHAVPAAIKNSLGMQFVLIPPGTFCMGATDDDKLAVSRAHPTLNLKEHFDRQMPQHEVTLTRPFYFAAYETTFGEFRSFVEQTKYVPTSEVNGSAGWESAGKFAVTDLRFNWKNSGYPLTDRHAVGSVLWNDAVAFCNWLSDRDGLPRCYVQHLTLGWVRGGSGGYRLPTEAEWEFAARAGTTTIWPFSRDYMSGDFSRFVVTPESNDLARQVTAVGTCEPNPFGLYDILGNAGEICDDYISTDYKADAGGVVDPRGALSGTDRAIRSHAFARYTMTPTMRSPVPRSHSVGFRVVREIAPPKTAERR